jgi:hypothetical protein
LLDLGEWHTARKFEIAVLRFTEDVKEFVCRQTKLVPMVANNIVAFPIEYSSPYIALQRPRSFCLPLGHPALEVDHFLLESFQLIGLM